MTGEAIGPIFTVGHSTRPIAEFVELLRMARITDLVDVRSIPRSRTNPQYNLDVLPETLAGYQIRHAFIAELGGRRGRQRGVDPKLNAFWRNQSFHNYADYAMTAEFGVGLDRLLSLSRRGVCAIMCAEAVWWRCHRRIIADYLLSRGRSVLHLMGEGRIEPATKTVAAVAEGDHLIYPG
jgi:uncharacterized protein (DUF488 family)